ncbi:HAD family hydrolase [Bradyrhizobium sp. LHD-71]|uniref:HAD family hydrolase n=1 Tax=Bradyrhizobium sp. LHD-71 TaxID=3072141 RepID=UPI00280C6957|nr:HAD family hydrolase [Bradyrhizobium sp. LHD-71]MDQ8730198.1 HAD family hydrolase [Bradyrhizobium sp. LHD-71]
MRFADVVAAGIAGAATFQNAIANPTERGVHRSIPFDQLIQGEVLGLREEFREDFSSSRQLSPWPSCLNPRDEPISLSGLDPIVRNCRLGMLQTDHESADRGPMQCFTAASPEGTSGACRAQDRFRADCVLDRLHSAYEAACEERSRMAHDPLPSWNDCAAKSTIIDFVARVTRAGGPDYVRPAERIATFDNDGTLWCEQPMQVQFFFGLARLEQFAMQVPDLRQRQPFKAFLEHDIRTIRKLGKAGFFEVAATTHAGMTEEDFDRHARNWLASTPHPQLGRPFTELTYRPQKELLSFLRVNGFKAFIVSSGDIDLIRAFAEEIYGVPREQVIGSSVKSRFEVRDERVVLAKLAAIHNFVDQEVKPQNIALHIGRRPIFAFGNSDADLPMLRYARTGPGPRLALLIHHDDADREFAYDRRFKVSPLSKALDKAGDYGITIVSMKRDWRIVFDDGFPPVEAPLAPEAGAPLDKPTRRLPEIH